MLPALSRFLNRLLEQSKPTQFTRSTTDDSLLQAFDLNHDYELQDLFSALILSECVYKMVDQGCSAAVTALTSFRDQFPNGTLYLTAAQCCALNRPIDHKYMLATGGGALYVALIGTKELRDVAVDVTIGQKAFVFPFHNTMDHNEQIATVHGGFLSRSHGIPIESLYVHARSQGLRLILCGHSLGGAVAMLCTLRLLSIIQPTPSTQQITAQSTDIGLHCICFGTPAVGNRTLSNMVDAQGWTRYISHYALPEDPIPRLFYFSPSLHSSMLNNDHTSTTGDDDGKVDGGMHAAGSAEEDDALLQENLLSKKRVFDAAVATTNNYSANHPATNDDNDDDDESSRSKGLGFSATIQRQQFSVRGAVKAAARTAGLLFHHFEEPVYLLPGGVQSSIPRKHGTHIESSRPPRGWLAPHRMWSYRARVLDICSRYPTQHITNDAVSSPSPFHSPPPPAAVQESSCLMPEVQITSCTMNVPVLWQPWGSLQEAQREGPRPQSSSYHVSGRPGHSIHTTTNALHSGSSSGNTDSSGNTSSSMNNTSISTTSNNTCTTSTAGGNGNYFVKQKPSLLKPKYPFIPRRAPESKSITTKKTRREKHSMPSSCRVIIHVKGMHLDVCNSVILRIQGVKDACTDIEATIEENCAKESIIAQTTYHAMTAAMPAGTHPEQSFSSFFSHWKKVSSSAPQSSHRDAGKRIDDPDEDNDKNGVLVVSCIVPTSVLLSVPRIVSPHEEQGSITLVLRTDFGESCVDVQLKRKNAWLITLGGQFVGEQIMCHLMADENIAQHKKITHGEGGGGGGGKGGGGGCMHVASVMSMSPSRWLNGKYFQRRFLQNRRDVVQVHMINTASTIPMTSPPQQQLDHQSQSLLQQNQQSTIRSSIGIVRAGVLVHHVSDLLANVDSSPLRQLTLLSDILQSKSHQHQHHDVPKAMENNTSNSKSVPHSIMHAQAATTSPSPSVASIPWQELEHPPPSHHDKHLHRHGSSDRTNVERALLLLHTARQRLLKLGHDARRRRDLHHVLPRIKDVSHPDIIVLIVQHDDIIMKPTKAEILTSADALLMSNFRSSSNSSSNASSNSSSNASSNSSSSSNMASCIFHTDVLDAIHVVASSAAACRAVLLLAVDSPFAHDALFRRRLSYSCGLYGRPGAVVPLCIEEGNNAIKDGGGYVLASAIAAYAKLSGEKALLEGRSSHNGNAESTFRARL